MTAARSGDFAFRRRGRPYRCKNIYAGASEERENMTDSPCGCNCHETHIERQDLISRTRFEMSRDNADKATRLPTEQSHLQRPLHMGPISTAQTALQIAILDGTSF
jgi:hypothetical protein